MKNFQREQRIGHVKDGGRAALSLSTYFNVKKRAPFEWQRLEKKIGKANIFRICFETMREFAVENSCQLDTFFIMFGVG